MDPVAKIISTLNLSDIARKQNFPLGLPIYYLRGTWLVEEWPDGHVVQIKDLHIEKVPVTKRTLRLD